MGKDIARIIRSFMGQDFIDGNLDKSMIAKLTHDVITRWDERYPLLEFPPCFKFQVKDVDPVKNWQIPNKIFIRCHSFKTL
jgi:hypothetical protein